jgi:GNAT superfamily N-acetyltransferase
MDRGYHLSHLADGHRSGWHADVRFRPETDDDLPFLEALYASTRAAELERVGWTWEQKASFLAMQFHLQRGYYREHFSDASFDIIQSGGQDIGRRYVARRRDALTIIDMALMPPWRRRGLGSSMLASLQGEAVALGVPIVLHVEYGNPAAHLYGRFGFEEVGSNGVYRALRWCPLPSAAISGAHCMSRP